ncbi:hypothetical protein BGZ54_005759, partial [Gamsiella multidivaricata]
MDFFDAYGKLLGDMIYRHTYLTQLALRSFETYRSKDYMWHLWDAIASLPYLSTLKLANFKTFNPTITLPRLRTLSLMYFQYAGMDELLGFISGCPALEYLTW